MRRLLDLFCGAGGAAMGYYRAGFECVGVDILPQTNYPFQFVLGDALEYLQEHKTEYDIIHASPPCQGYGKNYPRTVGYEYARLIRPLRALLKETGKPYIIENVEGAPLFNTIKLCGQMFGLPIIRHRLFETNFKLIAPVHGPHPRYNYFTVAGHEYGTLKEWKDAMGIDWMTRKELTQAIPPAYTEYIGRQAALMLSK